MSPDAWEFIKAALTVVGAVVVGVLSSWLLRRSQKESAQITLLTNLVDQVQEERELAKVEAKQVPLWRRYAQQLRKQIYGLGGVPVEADKELEL
jgi:hypothetical protein